MAIAIFNNDRKIYTQSFHRLFLGTGNYAGVFYHADYCDLVVKIYAPGKLGWSEELEVYRRLGSHPAFSTCFYAENN